MSGHEVNLLTTELARHLDDAGRAELAACARRELPKNQYLFSQGDAKHHYYLLLSGIIKIQRHGADGHFLTYELISPGMSFGELAAMDGGIRSASAIAASDALLVEIPRALFLRWVEQPQFSKFLLRRMNHMVRVMSERLARLSYASAGQRIASAILDWSEISGNVADAQIPSQDEWAATIDVSRETLARYLAQLQKDAVIEKIGRKIVVNDVQKLKSLMHHDNLLLASEAAQH